MSSLDASLAKITKGAGLAFGGSLVATFIGFISRPMVARYGTEAEYGVYSLALVVLSICTVIATLGLRQGTPRSIAYARGKNDTEKMQKLISASVQVGLIAGVSLAIIVFLTSDLLAARIFHDAAVAFPLRILAVGIPFFTLIYILVSIFQGLSNVKPMVYFENGLRPLLLLLFLLPIVFLKLPFDSVFYAFLASLVIACVVLIAYTRKRLPFSIGFCGSIRANPVARELLLFSLPLLGVAMLGLIIAWTDTLMLGGLKSSADVGLYNAAHPLANFISVPLSAIVLIYVPVAAELYAGGSMPEMKRDFSIVTKWLCSATLPLFLIVFLFPETVLSFLFGASYTSAATALRILSIGFMIGNFLGPNGASLTAMGEVRFVMRSTLAAALLNVGLNVALIPRFGIEGAAIASVAAITTSNVIRCWKLYSLSKAQPLSKNLLKPTLASLALVFLFQFIFGNFVTVVWWMLPLLFILYYVIYGLAILLTKSFDHEDITMLLAVEKRTGVNLSFLKRILRRFL